MALRTIKRSSVARRAKHWSGSGGKGASWKFLSSHLPSLFSPKKTKIITKPLPDALLYPPSILVPPRSGPKVGKRCPIMPPKLERGHRRFIFTALWQRCSQSSGKYTKRRWPGQEHIEANWSASTCAPYGSSERLENFVASSESGPGIILNQVYPKNQANQ